MCPGTPPSYSPMAPSLEQGLLIQVLLLRTKRPAHPQAWSLTGPEGPQGLFWSPLVSPDLEVYPSRPSLVNGDSGLLGVPLKGPHPSTFGPEVIRALKDALRSLPSRALRDSHKICLSLFHFGSSQTNRFGATQQQVAGQRLAEQNKSTPRP